MGKEIVLGLGDNIDYEIRWDSSIMEQLVREYGISAGELSTGKEIKTLRDLLVSILGFMEKNSGGERFVHNAEIIEAFSDRFEKKITLGGTAVRAAIAMKKLGYSSGVHLVTMNEHVKRLLPEDCEWLCSSTLESSYPHLIVQFRAGDAVHAKDIHIETSRANRIIYTNDPDNARMRLHPGLGSLLEDAKVFLISGFNAMNDPGLLKERLAELREILKTIPEDTAVFFEDGCYHVPKLSGIVREYLLPYICIYSLNEDEFEGYAGRPVSWTCAGAVTGALKDLHEIIPAPVFVVHTRHWALAYGENPGKYKKALLGGVTMATSRFRFGDDFTREDYEETGRLPPEEEGKIFAAEIEEAAGGKICCVPSFLVSEKNVTTIGLGDTFAGGFLPALIGHV
ncbi:MAG: ADP-dependent glucokinase/phosphofructokinase [Treponema sp.]|jgi:ADP-dependent phosphofructokinase/glucokinase|nr:ADP-dependent glucokinase/phosphofructokinase [Treponema sp.]